MNKISRAKIHAYIRMRLFTKWVHKQCNHEYSYFYEDTLGFKQLGEKQQDKPIELWCGFEISVLGICPSSGRS